MKLPTDLSIGKRSEKFLDKIWIADGFFRRYLHNFKFVGTYIT